MDLTENEIQEWWQLDATQKILNRFKEQRQMIYERVLHGGSLDDDVGITAQQTARAVGEVAGLEYFIDKGFVDEY